MTDLCLRERGMRPADFWALSLPELATILGYVRGASAPGRAALAALMARYPDG